jgi:hypothetical protein
MLAVTNCLLLTCWLLTKNKHSNNPIINNTMTASNNTTISQADRRAALLSWRLDILSCSAVIFLLICWLSDMKQLNQTTTTTGATTNDDSLLLSKSFLTNGFCLAPQLFDNTHFSCASFDFFCACVCILAILVGNVVTNINNGGANNKKKKKSLILPGSAIYFLAHSYGHYTFSSVDNEQQFTSDSESITEKIQSAIILSSILSIGPLEAASTLIKSNKLSPRLAYIMAGSMLAVLVGIYHFVLFNPSYALLYINISIILSISLPKLVFVGYTSEQDVKLRSKEVSLFRILSGMFVMVVIICEPFFCDVFFARIGGHFLFDLSLALDVVTAVVMEGTNRRLNGEDEEDEKDYDTKKTMKVS